jgi:DNA-binding transcriptional MerR regulator
MTNAAKIYYSIGEVADLISVNTSLIRFWEKEFDIIKPKKNTSGNRVFSVHDIKNIKLIYHLLKEKKYTIQGAKKKIRENKEGTMKNYNVIEKLNKIRNELVTIREHLKL